MPFPGKRNTEKIKSMQDLKFNTRIYKEEAIKKAITVYSHLAKFTVRNDKDYIRVKLDHLETGLKDVLADEFSNYVLGVNKGCF